MRAYQVPLVPTASPGFADIVGFGQSGVVIVRDDVSAQSATMIDDFGFSAGGWRIDKHVRLVADVTGDKRADIVGFGDGGVLVSSNNVNNTYIKPVKLVLADFGYTAGGWRVDKAPPQSLRYSRGRAV